MVSTRHMQMVAAVRLLFCIQLHNTLDGCPVLHRFRSQANDILKCLLVWDQTHTAALCIASSLQLKLGSVGGTSRDLGSRFGLGRRLPPWRAMQAAAAAFSADPCQPLRGLLMTPTQLQAPLRRQRRPQLQLLRWRRNGVVAMTQWPITRSSGPASRLSHPPVDQHRAALRSKAPSRL